MSDWTKALSEALQETADKVPKGWKTRQQIEEETGLKMAQAGRLIRTLLTKGKAERKLFRVMNGGTIRPVPFYRIRSS